MFVVPQTPAAAGFLVLWWEDALLWLSQMDGDLCYNLAQGHHGLGTAPFVLGSGVTSAPVFLLRTVLLEPSDISAFF